MTAKDTPGADKPRKRGPRPIVCLETGIVYESVSAAARAMGVTYGSGNLSQAAIHGGLFKGYHWYYEGDPKPKPGDLKGNKAVTCLETGEEFESAEAAAKWAKTTVDAVYASVRLHSTAGGYQFRLKDSEVSEYTGQPCRSGGRRKRPVVCHETGEVYESADAAAAAVGRKSATTIYTAIKTGGMSGGFHWYWEGDPKPIVAQLLQPKAKHYSKPVVCWETGQVFPSLKDAAEAAGLKNTSSIRNAIKKKSATGGYHWYWEGDPKPSADQLKFAKGTEKMPVRSVVCWETGEVYASLRKACEAVGIKGTHRITAAIKNLTTAGSFHWYWEGEPRPDASEFKSPSSRPVVCYETGEVYPSVRKAAAALGIDTPSNICAATKSHGTVGGYHWYYADQPRPSEDQLKHGRKRPVICYETGVEYESAAAAARAVNVPHLHVSSACKGGLAGGYHWYYADQPKPEPGSFKNNRPVVCWETDQVFSSTQEAAEWAGTTVSGIYTSLRTKSPSGGYHWYLQGNPRPEEFPPALGGRKPRSVVCYETGQVFPSAKQAAEFAGVSGPASIFLAMGERQNGQRRSAGGYHWFYADEPKPENLEAEPKPKEKAQKKAGSPRKKPRKSRPVICWETNVEYESADAAAASLGLKSSNVIRNAIRTGGKSGGCHWYCAGQPRPKKSELKQPKKRKATKKPKKPEKARKRIVCLESGEMFATTKDAAAAVGLKGTSRISRALRDGSKAGGFHWYWEGDPKPSGTSGRRGRKPRPVVCAETGVAYASASEAAAAVGVKSPGNITVAARTGDKSGGLHWYFQGEDGPKEKERKPRAVVCWETDEAFPSEEAAAEWAGTTVGAINTVLHTRRCAGGYHWYLASKPKPDASKLSGRRGVVCLETGEVYSSAQAAADAVGVSRDTMYAALRSSNHAVGGYHWYWEGDPKPDASEFKPRKNRPIRCVESGVVYESVTAAARAVGTKHNSSISRAARTGGTAAGHHWEYVEA